MQFFYHLSSLGNLYNFSVHIIVLALFGRFMVHALCILYGVLVVFFENSNIDIGAI